MISQDGRNEEEVDEVEHEDEEEAEVEDENEQDCEGAELAPKGHEESKSLQMIRREQIFTDDTMTYRVVVEFHGRYPGNLSRFEKYRGIQAIIQFHLLECLDGIYRSKLFNFLKEAVEKLQL